MHTGLYNKTTQSMMATQRFRAGRSAFRCVVFFFCFVAICCCAGEDAPISVPLLLLREELRGYPEGKPLPVQSSLPTHRQLQRVYYALLREATLEGLHTDLKKGEEDAKRISLLRDAVITACAQAGEFPYAPENYPLGKALCELGAAHGKPPAVMILGAYLQCTSSEELSVLYIDGIDTSELREKIAIKFQPAEKEITNLPPLLQALWHLNRTQYSNVAKTIKHFQLYTEQIVTACEKLPVPAPTAKQDAYSSQPSEGGIFVPFSAGVDVPVVYSSLRRIRTAEALVFVNLCGHNALRHPFALRALQDAPATALGSHRYSEKAAEGCFWLKEKKGWEWLGYLAIGHNALEIAWDNRGGGFASSITEEGGAAYEKYGKQAMEAFEKSWALRPDMPHAAGVMIRALKSSNCDSAEGRRWLDRSLEARLDFMPAIAEYKFFDLESRWGGSPEWQLLFGYDCLNAGRYDTFRPCYGFMLLRLYYSEQEKYHDWRFLWRRPEAQRAGEAFFEGMLSEPANAAFYPCLRVEYALFKMWCGRYQEAATDLAALDHPERQLKRRRPPGPRISYGDIGWQRIQNELHANTGPYAARIKDAEDLILSGKTAEGIALWEKLICESRGTDDRTAGYLRWRGGHILLAHSWDLSKEEFALTRSPLYLAAALDRRDVIDWLLRNGENPCKVDEDGSLPLHAACLRNRPEILRLFLKNGIEKSLLNLAQPKETTLLTAAAENGGTETIRLLLAAGAEINRPNAEGETPIYIASQKESTETLQVLIDAGADIHKPCNEYAWQPIHIAAREGRVEQIKLLLQAGADVNAFSGKGWTPLYLAGVHNKKEAAQFLLEKGAQANLTQEEDGRLPLHTAAQYSDVELVRMLLQAGTPIDARSKDGQTALTLACSDNRPEMVSFLLEQKANPDITYAEDNWTALQFAARKGKVEIVRLLIQAGAKINARTKGGHTALTLAGKQNHTEIVRLLLEHKADPDVVYGSKKWTALHAAAYYGHVDVMDLLLAHGAAINAQLSDGRSALYIACEMEQTAAVILLIKLALDQVCRWNAYNAA